MASGHLSHALHGFSVSHALRSVFISTSSSACTSSSIRSSRLYLGYASPQPHSSLPIIQRRCKTGRANNDVVSDLIEQEARREAAQKIPAALRFARPDRDEGIRARTVVLVDRTTNKLTNPMPLREVLQRIDRKTEFLVRVGAATEGTMDQPQLCKVMPKKEVFDQEDQKARQATEAKKRKKKREGKSLEIGWNTAEGDLKYRFKKAEEFLQKGDRVNFLFENRQRKTVVPPDKAQGLLDRVKEAMSLIPKVAEVEREGKLGGKLKVIFEMSDADK